MVKMLPSKDDIDLEGNLSRIINPADGQLLNSKPVDNSEKDAVDREQ
jgi:hypothetical protein